MIGSSIKLRELIPEQARQAALEELTVNGLSTDSRTLQPGQCFLAYPGHAADGRRYIKQALDNGAAVVLAEAEGLDVADTKFVVAVPQLKQKMGDIASRFYGNPSAALPLVAVTGTNGKTTVSQLLAQAVHLCGKKSGVIGTLGNGPLDQLEATQNTTPDIISINRLLHEMRTQGINVVAMEASSHGLAQGRLDGLNLHTGIITNLSRDHLDYHGTMEAYRDAKALLVSHAGLKHLILNADDDAIASMAQKASASTKVEFFSLQAGSTANIRATEIRFGLQGLELDVLANGVPGKIHSRLIGEFNAANLLAALAGLLTLGIDLDAACNALSQCRPVVGRMEILNQPDAVAEPVVVVDFAHTPDALEKVLTALRLHCQGKLWCVFGCGGDRDAGKRPLMGRVVADKADCRVVTSDNPRSERPLSIISEIVKGLPDQTAFEVIENRYDAVNYAVLNAEPGDVVLVAGKGHEDYQEIQGVKHPYSDMKAAQDALVKRRQLQMQGG